MAAMAMDHVVLMINAPVTTESTESLLGLSPIVLEELALNIPPGLELSRMPTMLTPWLSALIRELVIENPANANVSPTTTELPVSALFAPIDAVMLVCASPKSNLPLRPEEPMTPLGMLTNKLDAFVIWEDVVLTALCLSVLLVLMFLRVMVMKLVVIAVEEVCAITRQVFAVASTVTTALNASIKLSSVKHCRFLHCKTTTLTPSLLWSRTFY